MCACVVATSRSRNLLCFVKCKEERREERAGGEGNFSLEKKEKERRDEEEEGRVRSRNRNRDPGETEKQLYVQL